MPFVKKTTHLAVSVGGSIKEALSDNPDIQKMTAKHPRIWNLLKSRLGWGKFTALPLTVLGVLFLYVLLLFFGVVDHVLTSTLVVATDTRLANLLYLFRDPLLVEFFWDVTILGEIYFVLVVGAVATAWLWLYPKRFFIVPLWLTLIGSELFVGLGKLGMHRMRPAGNIQAYAESSYAFPSNHATMAVAFYGFLAYILFRLAKSWRRKAFILISAVLLIFFIGFSRLYLGVHFYTDVWAGYLLGALWLLIGVSFSEWKIWVRNYLHLKQAEPRRRVRVARFFLLTVPAVAFVVIAVTTHPNFNLPVPSQVNYTTVSKTMLPALFGSSTLPKFSETLNGNPQEPLSFIVMAPNDDAFRAAMLQAHWAAADRVTLKSVYRTGLNILFNKEYPNAPVTPTFWNYRVNDFGFEKPTTTNSARQRHHNRFWKTDLQTADGDNVYVGTVSLDVGVKWFVTHRIEPAIDTEREFLMQDLNNTGLVQEARRVQFTRPVLGKNFTGDQFFTDGEAYVVKLK